MTFLFFLVCESPKPLSGQRICLGTEGQFIQEIDVVYFHQAYQKLLPSKTDLHLTIVKVLFSLFPCQR